MHIVPIQKQMNMKPTNFKAHFLDDDKGYFRDMWLTADKSRSLLNLANQLHDFREDDMLEIVNKKKNYTSVEYEIFNHNTGFKSSYKVGSNVTINKTLEFLLDSVLSDKNLFLKDLSSHIYNLLLKR